MQELEVKPPVPQEDEDIDLWAIVQTFWRRRLLIVAVTVAGTVGTAFYVFSLPNIYSASATIMPVDSSSDRLSTALSSLGALGGLASQAGVGMKGSVSDKFVALLKSRTVAERVILKHDLLPVLFPERWDSQAGKWKETASSLLWVKATSKSEPPTMHQALRRLRGIVSTKADPKAGMVIISVEHTNPGAAADISNYFVAELNAYLQGNSFTSAKQNKDFLEKQLKKVTLELKSLEGDLKRFQEEHKLVSLDAQTQASVQAYASLKSQLMAKEMDLSLQERSASENDIQLLGIRQEIAQIREKLASIEDGQSGGLVSFKDAPQLGMHFAQLTRELLVRQKVFELITQQYELSKIEEAKETLSFQVIDEAMAPDQKSKPKRLSSIVVAFVLSLSLSGLLVLIIEYMTKQLNRIHLQSRQ